MNHIESYPIERVRGASIGATIMGGFGALWLAMGMANAGMPVVIALALAVPVFVLIAGAGIAVRRLPRLACAENSEKKRRMRIFAAVNLAEWIAIIGSVNLLRNLHLEEWIVPVIVLIVGAHFIPLAGIFQAPRHRTTGIALMVLAALAPTLPGSIRAVVECVAAGLILWMSAGGALYAAFRMASRSRSSEPGSVLSAGQAGL
jgi:hypothetical protein